MDQLARRSDHLAAGGLARLWRRGQKERQQHPSGHGDVARQHQIGHCLHDHWGHPLMRGQLACLPPKIQRAIRDGSIPPEEVWVYLVAEGMGLKSNLLHLKSLFS